MHKKNKKACYFLSLKIENVACFGKSQTLDLTDKEGKPARWTVIMGDNGIGKTTLLRSLAITFLFGDRELEEMLPPIHNFFFSDVAERKKNAVIESRFGVDSSFVDLGMGSRVLTRTIEAKPNGLIKPNGDGGNSYYACHGYGAARQMRPVKISRGPKIDIPVASLFDDDHPLLNAEEWLLQADYISTKDKKYTKYKKQVEEIIIKLLPDVTDIDYKVSQQVSKVVFKTPTGWVSIKELSLGYRTMLAWMVDFAAGLFNRYPESDDPLAEPAVLLVDEIDLHLHPRWQRTLIDFLTERFPNTQFIATAHSPLMIQAAEGANLVLLKRKGNDVIIDNNPASIKNWRIDQILTSDLFGLESAHSTQTSRLMDERTRLLSQPSLTPEDKRRMSQLEDALSSMPFGNTKEEIQADFLIKEIAQKIRRKEKAS